jgi:hypothetical protein
MARFRFSMRNLLLAVLVLSLALAVLQWDSEIIASIAFTAFLGLLALGVTGAFCRRGAARAFWIGFAVFGWFYAEAAFPAVGGSSSSPGTWLLGFAARAYEPRRPPSPIVLTELLFDFASLNSQLRVGNKVMAQWQSGGYYEATITEIKGGQYLAKWTDGSNPSWVVRNQIEITNAAGRHAAHSIMAIFVALVGAALAEMFFARGSGDEEPRGREDPRRERQFDRVDAPAPV